MDSAAFWILVFPLLLLAVLYFLGFLTIGSTFVSTAFKAKGLLSKTMFLVIGIGVISFPIIAIKVQHIQADRKADQRHERLSNIERINLKGRMPRRFVTVGNYSKSDTDFISKRYRIGQYPQEEAQRLSAAYRAYRRVEYCHSHSSGKTLRGTQIPICRDLPVSIQAALDIKEPILFFAEGASTSYRISNTFVGNMFEIRLVTHSEDLLVDYYEDRFLERPAGITNPFTSGFTLDPNGQQVSRKDFIERALDGAKP